MTTSTTSQPGSSSVVAPTRRARREELNAKIGPLAKVVVFEQRRPWTVVKLELVYRRAIWYGIGFTKVCVPDRWDPTYGKWLAATKAQADLVRQIMVFEDARARDAAAAGANQERHAELVVEAVSNDGQHGTSNRG